MEKNEPILDNDSIKILIDSHRNSRYRYRRDLKNEAIWLDLEDESLDSKKMIADRSDRDPEREEIVYYSNETSAFGFGNPEVVSVDGKTKNSYVGPVTLEQRSMKVIRGEVPDPYIDKLPFVDIKEDDIDCVIYREIKEK